MGGGGGFSMGTSEGTKKPGRKILKARRGK
jgi:hypothetical protein